MNPDVSQQIYHYLAWRLADPAATTKMLSVWVPVLLSQPIDLLSLHDWAHLLSRCRYPEDKIVSTQLFDVVTAPRISIEPGWTIHSGVTAEVPRTRVELNLFEDSGVLTQTWRSLFFPNLSNYLFDLEPVVSANLLAAHRLLETHEQTSRTYDPLGHSRQLIEARNDGTYPEILDLLIDTGREILVELLNQNHPHAQALIDRWFRSEVPIFRRLAINAFPKRSDLSADEKLHWLIDQDLIYQFKPDVFWFLQQVYPSASVSTRAAFVERALRGPIGPEFVRFEEPLKKYMIYNLLVWLNRVAPDCVIGREKLASLAAENPDFAPRDRPELNSFISSAPDPIASIDIDSIAADPPVVFLDKLVGARGDPGSRVFLSASPRIVSAVVAKKPGWGCELLTTMAERKIEDDIFWQSVCFGWESATLSLSEWGQVLRIAATIQAPTAFFEAFVRVLARSGQSEQGNVPDELLPKGQKVATRIWNDALESIPPREEPDLGWSSDILNQTGGKLAEFWLNAISVSRKQSVSWTAINPDLRQGVTAILGSKSGVADFARVAFASELHYLFSVDPSFTVETLVPLFDWQNDTRVASQCWSGFLARGRWMPDLVEPLLPFFNATAREVKKLKNRLQERLAMHIAYLAVFLLVDPLKDGWLSTTVQELGTQNLVQFAEAIDRILEELSTERCETLWDLWLRKYWQERQIGLPQPLSSREAEAMACWGLSVGRHFPEAVRMAMATPEIGMFANSALLYRIRKKELIKPYPQSVADLLLLVLKRATRYVPASPQFDSLWQDLQGAEVSADTLRKIAAEAMRLGHELEYPNQS